MTEAGGAPASHGDSDAPPSSDGPLVVGIGASAGGVSALRTLLGSVPENSGLAFVVVVHLASERESLLAHVLQPHVAVPVQQVTEETALRANHVYVIPPGYNLDTIDSHVRLSRLEARGAQRAPIDHFFRTLAATHENRAVGIVLTGTGSDGTLGLEELKGKGALTIAQDPKEAEYGSMPQSAIATGLVDLVLPLSQMIESILIYAGTRPRLALPEEHEDVDRSQRQLLSKIFAQVKAQTGRDFSRHKRSTLLRRIQRRMQLAHTEELSDYLERLRRHPEEVTALADEFLVTVTSFFRDPEVFAELERSIIPRLVQGKNVEQSVRVWSIGCATGEEAYSLAMLLVEVASRLEVEAQLQVFATDLHEPSLQRAREGFYSGDIQADVSPERLRRFFDATGGGYRIKRELRELVLFAPHNLLGNPPFSKIDLVSCRNLMIYLQRDVQPDVIKLFHYALNPEGYLVVGTSETVDRSELFRNESKSGHIYQKRDVRGPELHLPVFPLMPGRLSEPRPAPLSEKPATSYGVLHQKMVEVHAPPSVLLGPEQQVVHISERAGQYLQVPGGEVTSSIFRLVRDELRIELRAILHAAQHEGRGVRSKPIALGTAGSSATHVVLQVLPDAKQPGYFLLLFHEWEGITAAAGEKGELQDSAAAELEAELELTKRRLQSVIEDQEASREEMKASNEELQSMNEELRSTLEELETSKEELQSINEELTTLNQENRYKVEELGQLSADLQNLLTATDIATLFLDRELRIMRFTPRVSELFNVLATDRGRAISDLTHRLGYDELVPDVERVLRELSPIEREVQDERGRWYLTRVLTYQSSEHRIDGVVITFVEVTRRKQAEEAMRRVAERQAYLVQLADVLRPLSDPLQIQLVSAGLLGRALGATRAFFVRIDSDGTCDDVAADFAEDGVESLVGRRPFDGWGQRAFAEALAGRSSSVEDVSLEPRLAEAERAALAALGVRAYLSLPLVKAGKPVGIFVAHQREPHTWDSAHIELAEQTSERVWAAVEHSRSKETQLTESRRKDEFLAMLAHELRNPLTPIRNGLALLRLGVSDPAKLESIQNTMERQLVHLMHLVDDLLDVSRITRGVIELRKKPLDLADVIQTALDTSSLSRTGGARRLRVEASSEPLVVLGDSSRLVQAVANLLGNAVKYTHEKGNIWLTVSKVGQTALISVRDDGIGIAPELLPRVFDLFVQGNRWGAAGLGIGLTLAKSLIKMHDGSIEVQSDGLGQGTEFVVRLPLSATPLRESEPPEALHNRLPQAPLSGRALVIDDNQDAGETLGMLLELSGIDVKVVFDGPAGVAAFDSFKPSVVYLDIGMPGMDGYQVARALRQRPGGAQVLIVALTGWGKDSDRQKTREAGFDHHLVKPVSLQDLTGVLGQQKALEKGSAAGS